MALKKPLNFDSRIEWIKRHTRDARTAIQSTKQSGFSNEQFATVANIYDALVETLLMLEDLIKDNT